MLLRRSLKGEADIDWDDEAAREAFLKEVVADADRLLEMVRQALENSVDDVERERLIEAAELLTQLLLQDIERRPDGAGLMVELSDRWRVIYATLGGGVTERLRTELNRYLSDRGTNPLLEGDLSAMLDGVLRDLVIILDQVEQIETVRDKEVIK